MLPVHLPVFRYLLTLCFKLHAETTDTPSTQYRNKKKNKLFQIGVDNFKDVVSSNNLIYRLVSVIVHRLSSCCEVHICKSHVKLKLKLPTASIPPLYCHPLWLESTYIDFASFS